MLSTILLISIVTADFGFYPDISGFFKLVGKFLGVLIFKTQSPDFLEFFRTSSFKFSSQVFGEIG